MAKERQMSANEDVPLLSSEYDYLRGEKNAVGSVLAADKKNPLLSAEPQKPLKEKKEPSAKTLAANSKNAQKSTGARTDAGKAKSSLNAVKHGLTCSSKTLALFDLGEGYEEQAKWILDDLNPKGAIEVLLVEQIISSKKHLYLAESIENGIHTRLRMKDTQYIDQIVEYRSRGHYKQEDASVKAMRKEKIIKTLKIAPEVMTAKAYDESLPKGTDALTSISRYRLPLVKGLRNAIQDYIKYKSSDKERAGEADDTDEESMHADDSSGEQQPVDVLQISGEEANEDIGNADDCNCALCQDDEVADNTTEEDYEDPFGVSSRKFCLGDDGYTYFSPTNSAGMGGAATVGKAADSEMIYCLSMDTFAEDINSWDVDKFFEDLTPEQRKWLEEFDREMAAAEQSLQSEPFVIQSLESKMALVPEIMRNWRNAKKQEFLDADYDPEDVEKLFNDLEESRPLVAPFIKVDSGPQEAADEDDVESVAADEDDSEPQDGDGEDDAGR